MIRYDRLGGSTDAEATLTQKLVPLLAKIKTKGMFSARVRADNQSLQSWFVSALDDPTYIQMATLAVHEAMGAKVDREAVAGLVLPQLWAMSMGPCKCNHSTVPNSSAQCRSIRALHDVSASIFSD